MELNRIIEHDVKQPFPLDDESVNCCVTSPPYWGLRDYGKSGQLGLEKTPEEFITNMVKVFREVKRVLKNDGTCWVNMGDSYAATGKSRSDEQACRKSTLMGSTTGQIACKDQQNKIVNGLKPKDLVGIPWMLAFALRADGWYLRQDIIWHKPNPMPESVTDRCTKSHEYIFLLSKSQKYYYDSDAIRTESKNPLDDIRRIESQTWENKNTPDNLRNGIRPKKVKVPGGWDRGDGAHGTIHRGGRTSAEYQIAETKSGANKRTVWTVPTMPYPDAHFATFPEDLIVDCIKAGCHENGAVLDPFMGAGTTALVSAKLNRNFIGFELNEKYIKIAEKRLQKELGMFNPLRA